MTLSWNVLKPNGEEVASIIVNSDDTVASAKQQLLEVCGTPIELICLIYEGRILDNEEANGSIPDSASITFVQNFATIRVPQDYRSIAEAMLKLPDDGGIIEIHASHSDAPPVVSKPNVRLRGCYEEGVVRLAGSIFIAQTATGFLLDNVEVGFLSDPFGNFARETEQSPADLTPTGILTGHGVRHQDFGPDVPAATPD